VKSLRKGVILSFILMAVLVFVSVVYAASFPGDAFATCSSQFVNTGRDHIATLQKEMIDIRTNILKKSDEVGFPACKKLRKNYGMIERRKMSRECPRHMAF
jgi:hypothetical protein